MRTKHLTILLVGLSFFAIPRIANAQQGGNTGNTVEWEIINPKSTGIAPNLNFFDNGNILSNGTGTPDGRKYKVTLYRDNPNGPDTPAKSLTGEIANEAWNEDFQPNGKWPTNPGLAGTKTDYVIRLYEWNADSNDWDFRFGVGITIEKT